MVATEASQDEVNAGQGPFHPEFVASNRDAGLDLRLGLANVIAHVDRVLALLESGKLDPAPLVTHHMALDEASEAYAIYDRREALKIVLTP